MRLIELKYPKGYAVKGLEIIGKWGRPMKADRRDVFTLQADEGRIRATRSKIVWCAMNGRDIRRVPREYSFRIADNGIVIVETFSDRMSYVRHRQNMAVKVQWEDYDFIERFARTAKQMIEGKPDARRELFLMLNGKRDEFIGYARRSCGGVSEKRATDYADMAIVKVYDSLCSRTFAIASPIASIKWHIRKFITDERNKRTYETD